MALEIDQSIVVQPEEKPCHHKDTGGDALGPEIAGDIASPGSAMRHIISDFRAGDTIERACQGQVIIEDRSVLMFLLYLIGPHVHAGRVMALQIRIENRLIGTAIETLGLGVLFGVSHLGILSFYQVRNISNRYVEVTEYKGFFRADNNTGRL